MPGCEAVPGLRGKGLQIWGRHPQGACGFSTLEHMRYISHILPSLDCPFSNVEVVWQMKHSIKDNEDRTLIKRGLS